MDQPTPTKEKRARLAPDVRRRQLVEVAGGLALSQGYLPVSAEKLAAGAGVSKALIYAYFPTQQLLFNAVLARQFDDLLAAGLEEASRAPTLEAAALASALIYFNHVATAGPIIHVILRDQYMAGQVDRRVGAARDRVILRLAMAARRELHLTAKENRAAINMIITIPEEAGRLAYAGEIKVDRARALCAELIASSLKAFKPRAP